jgi:hypothetical protein
MEAPIHTDLRRPPRSGRRSPVAVPAAATLVVIVLVLLLVLVPQPHSLSYGNGVTAPLGVGETLVAEMGDARGRGIAVQHAVPVVKPGSAQAAIEVFVCHSDTAYRSVGYTTGWTEVQQECRTVRPADGAHLRAHNLNDPFDYFIMAVTPLAPGPIEIDGLRVTHSGWWRETTERSGVELVINGR